MNIGINASFLRKPGTGIGQVTVNFLRKLAESATDSRRLTDCQFFLYCEEPPVFDFDLPANFHIRSFLPAWRRDDLLRKILWETRLLPKRAREDGCDVFWSLYQSPTMFQGAGSKRQAAGTGSDGRSVDGRIKHVMLIHDLIPKIFSEYVGNFRKRLYWRLTERGIRGADALLSVSERTKEDLVDMLAIPEERILIAPPGISTVFEKDLPRSEAVRVLAKYGLVSGGYVYHGGGLEVRKNAEMLLAAYAALREKHPDIPPLVISGTVFPESNPLATPVERIVRRLGIDDRVKLLGFVPEEDLPALYHGAKLFAYPSRYEGFGLPVVEAMSQGTPVISSDASSLPETAGDAALLVDPDDRDALLAAMERLVSDEALRRDLSEKGRRQASNFSYDGMVGKFLEISGL